jgi:hypothetical protein
VSTLGSPFIDPLAKQIQRLVDLAIEPVAARKVVADWFVQHFGIQTDLSN